MPKPRYVRKNKKFPKRFKKRRFSRKRFSRSNNKVRSSLNSTILPKELYVKLPFSDVATLSTAGGGVSRSYNMTSIAPLDTAANIAVGSKIVASIPEYSPFYDNYTPLGASIKIMITNNTSTTLAFRCVLVPITVSNTANISTQAALLDTYDYEDLSSIPGSITRIMGVSNSSTSAVYFKSFRKTKNMLSIKDTRDASFLKLDLPVVTIGGTASILEDQCWFYYFKTFATGTTNIDIYTKIKFYYMLSGRKTITQAITTA